MIPTLLLLVSWLLLLAGPVAAADWPVRDSREWTEVARFPAGGSTQALEVDNIFGSISVEASRGDEVRLAARETVRARNAAAVERARREVSLTFTEKRGALRLIVDGPFRRPDGSLEWRNDDYEVHYDIELQVPEQVDVELRTINAGDISVRGVSGDFVISNVNGGIELLGVAGGGRLRTTNGGIELRFADNPERPWSLKTLNGDLDVTFQPRLAADLRFQASNGDVYTDFEVTPRRLPPPEPRRRGGKLVIRREHAFGARVAAGGPEHRFETLNGDVYIRRADAVEGRDKGKEVAR